VTNHMQNEILVIFNKGFAHASPFSFHLSYII
jgi:hypothetical protein